MIPAIVKDLFNIFVQSLKLNLLFFQEKNYENEPTMRIMRNPIKNRKNRAGNSIDVFA
ncbi:hypothetical protein BKAS_0804 [Bifidobacterium catenulatum subsp. kashiwanohense JCM 15439 = DSM 21854]|nr:hypothetical protein BKAS_0804 [Bifidobacterium catenulatum subsp. kashiwanohense JCM 15439 = DSM 21854]BAQ29736.1 hypothetical protein BBKW_1601 [Bifidobacterium catenulatum subsp. kashiwanohense JCM 15439 = DSM 21854]